MYILCAQSTLPRPITAAPIAPPANHPIQAKSIPTIYPLLHGVGASAILRRACCGLPSSPPYRLPRATVARQNPSHVSRRSHPGPSKDLLRAREAMKEHSPLASLLSLQNPPELSPSQAIGMVASAQANFMRVFVLSAPSEASRGSVSGVELLCSVKAVLKKIRRKVLVGDKVLVGSIDWVDRRGMIENVFERSSRVLVPPVANVDRLLLLFSMDQPRPEPLSLSRFLVEAESTGIPLTLSLNKSELVSHETITAWKSRLCSWGYDPIFCSVNSKDGLDTLALALSEQTSVIVGPSGVGKSSLINALRSNQDISDAPEGKGWIDHMGLILGSKWFEDQRVNEVSTRSGRGKHTTRDVSLLPLVGGGYLADTPGFDEPNLMNVTKHSLARTFPEIRQILSSSEPAKCAFSNCLHLREPRCRVKGAWERYPHYLQLLDEITIREELQLRTMGTKRESDVKFKMGKKGDTREEPKLETKKHRRQSRSRVNQSILNELAELDDDYLNEVMGWKNR